MKHLTQGHTDGKWPGRDYEASRPGLESVRHRSARWAWRSDYTWEVECVSLAASLPFPSVFMAHWKKQGRAVDPRVTIVQLPPWHCHSRLPSLARGSNREYHRRFAMDQDSSGESSQEGCCEK